MKKLFILLFLFITLGANAQNNKVSGLNARQFHKYWKVESESPDYKVTFQGDTAEILSPKGLTLWRKEKMLERNLSTTLFIPDISTGSYISYAAYDNYLKRKSKLVLNHQISPHKLRHTHASLLAANGMTPEQIARRLGHGRSDVTQDIYIHVTQQVVANDNKTIDSINLIS